jgi:putative transposase
MNLMGIEAIYPRKKTTFRDFEHKIFPYLLRKVPITYPNQVWSIDITYIPLSSGFLYLTAIIDWFSRFVLSWEISNSLSNDFCISALKDALTEYGKPSIFNSDQGSQFTADNFIKVLSEHEIKISMDGRGRALDNVYIERFWRTIKYEDIYLKQYTTGKELFDGVRRFIDKYNYKRTHSSLDGVPPVRVYRK